MEPRNNYRGWAIALTVAPLVYALFWFVARPNFLAEEWWYINIGRLHGPFASAQAFAATGHPNFRLGFDWIWWALDIVYHGDPLWFAITNVVVKIGSAALLFGISKRIATLFGLTKKNSLALGAIAAAVFYLNPLHVEVINWVSCLNVTLGLLMGLWGINVLMSYSMLYKERGCATFVNFVRLFLRLIGALMAFATALLFRETAVFWPVIGLVLVSATLVAASKKWLPAVPVAIGVSLLDATYLVIRHAYMGKSGLYWLSKLHGAPFKHNLTVSLNNAVLPLGREVAYLASENWVTQLTVIFLLTAACRAAWQKGFSQQGRYRFAIDTLLVLGLGFQIWLYTESVIDIFTTWAIWLFGGVACIAWLYYMRRNERLRLLAVIVQLALVAFNFTISDLVTRIYLMPLAIIPVWLIGKRQTEEDAVGKLAWICAGSLVAVLALSILGAGIGQQYWGENQRESYEASTFGALAVACCLMIIAGNSTKVLRWSAGLTLTVFGGLLAWHNYCWANDHNRIEDNVTAVIKQVIKRGPIYQGRPRRIYVLCASESVWNEESYPIAEVLDRNRGNVELRIAFLAFGGLSTDKVVVSRKGANRYGFQMNYAGSEPSPYFRPIRPEVRVAKNCDAAWFGKPAGTSNISLVGRMPGDVVAVMSGDTLEIIDRYP